MADSAKRDRAIALSAEGRQPSAYELYLDVQTVQESAIVSNVVNALKQEVLRLARKEAKAEIGKARKAVAQHRMEIARLKRLLAQREREVKYLRKQVQGDQVRSEDAALAKLAELNAKQ